MLFFKALSDNSPKQLGKLVKISAGWPGLSLVKFFLLAFAYEAVLNQYFQEFCAT